jgi:hypothetical protein
VRHAVFLGQQTAEQLNKNPAGFSRGLPIALMMEAAGTSQTSVNVCQTTWHYKPQYFSDKNYA